MVYILPIKISEADTSSIMENFLNVVAVTFVYAIPIIKPDNIGFWPCCTPH